ncbi:MAG TPA: trypsin-like peptidase domain-containing protein [Streptosporangiaceae bacterium]|jgi:S1-C subfamily serine protease|nr:trypsin-like peptidase domain-containing protein [Streptosporangiaceae bacterium]
MQDDDTGSGADAGPVGAAGEPAGPGEPAAGSEAAGGGEALPASADGGPQRHRRGRAVVYTLVILAAAGLGSAAAIGLTSHPGEPTTGVSSHQVPGPQNNVASRGSLRTSAVAAKVDPGVVDVDAAIAYSGGTSSEGTGMIISRDGLILTNNHVINGSNKIKVRLVTPAGNTQYTATVVGYDATHDVALLKISGLPGLRPVAMGNSAQIALGTPVVALGNAEGQGGRPRAAAGIINSLNKTISPTDESTGATETLHDMLQTDADIVSGDSGGPLANAAGQVIGMTTANASSSQSSSSVLGYAIPINTALAIAHQIATGQASSTVQIGLPGFLGVLVPQSTSSSPQQQAAQQRQQERQQEQQGSGPGPGGNTGPPGTGSCAQDNSDTSVPASIAPAGRGALVDGVLCSTPAADAGLVSGDVITTVNGQAVTTPGSLTRTMEGFHPGARVVLGWQTATGQDRTGTVRLAPAPAK